jgi:serpin B
MRPSKSACLILTLILIAVGCKQEPVKTRTPLHNAARTGNLRQAKTLISSGADVNANGGWADTTALHLAAAGGYHDLVELLVANGADVHAKDKDGRTPLEYAASQGHRQVVELLLAKGADVDAKDKKGETPLHAAALQGHKDVVELLIGKGANINAKNRASRTPLDYAAVAGHYHVVELLVANGAKVAAKGKQEPAVSAMVAAAQPNVRTLVQDNSAFAFDLYHKLRSGEGNLFFSPYSISAALAMTYAGARANTEKQMAKALRFSLDQEKLHPAFAGLQGWVNHLQEGAQIKLCVANSLWPQKDYKFLNEYLSLVKKHYGVSITPVDYVHALEAARETINRWVEQKTEYRIKDMIQPGIFDIPPVLALVNAIYFKGTWENQFNPRMTSEALFYITPEKSVRIPMMDQEETVRYAEVDDLQILELPYRGDSLSMLVVLPKEIDGLGQLERSLSVENLDSWRRHLSKTGVRIFLPRSRMTCEFRLDKTLQAMGMVDAFILGKADFAGMTGTDKLFISAVIHKAFVEVNEEGTEAGAATLVTPAPGRSAEPSTFRADHPFLFLIQENRTGSILFIGRVTDPTKSGQ